MPVIYKPSFNNERHEKTRKKIMEVALTAFHASDFLRFFSCCDHQTFCFLERFSRNQIRKFLSLRRFLISEKNFLCRGFWSGKRTANSGRDRRARPELPPSFFDNRQAHCKFFTSVLIQRSHNPSKIFVCFRVFSL